METTSISHFFLNISKGGEWGKVVNLKIYFLILRSLRGCFYYVSYISPFFLKKVFKIRKEEMIK